MRQRTRSYQIFYRGGDTIGQVPITERCTRRFMLMQEDYIIMAFALDEPIVFSIGDTVNDELFGRFVLSEEYLPRYNTSTGGYEYQLRMDADYMCWKSHIFCLFANGQRMETSWHLTDRLASHVQQIADNVNGIYGWEPHSATNPDTGETKLISAGYGISVDAEKMLEYHHIQYDAINIIEAMNRIAQEFGCEWWVTNDPVTSNGVEYQHTIHFGKCVFDNEPYEMRLGVNVESMDIARDQQTYCNRIYAFGGTRNIPEDYDRKLVFTATEWVSRTRVLNDSTRELSLEMIQGESTVETNNFDFGQWQHTGADLVKQHSQVISASLHGYNDLDIDIDTYFAIEGDDWAGYKLPTVGLVVTLSYGTHSETLYNRDLLATIDQVFGYKTWHAPITIQKGVNVGGSASSPVEVIISIVFTVTYPNMDVYNRNIDTRTDGTVTYTKEASTGTKAVTVVVGGEEYQGTFSGETKKITLNSTPAGLSVGDQYTIANLNLLKVPLSYYTVDYDTGALAMVGSRRLHLPLSDYPHRYMDTGESSESAVVESAVVFDGIYPKLDLRIASVGSQPMQQRVEHSDGSTSYDKWTQYTFTLEYPDGTPFQFRTSYMLDGNKLQAVFSAPASPTSPNLLAGMTFDVGFDERVYTIIRNEDYGVLLPNEVLKPSVGDSVVLVGWNPRAINALDIVSRAEEELASKSEQYLEAVKSGQFTFTCNMMSDWPFDLLAQPFIVIAQASGREHYTTDSKPFYVSNGYTEYALLREGCPVRVHHDALPEVEGEHYKDSRIIGYEFKLDKPYDTPRYTIGETDAYSRLKMIEKELTKL